MSGGESLRESAVFNLGGAVTMIVDDSPFSLTLTANALAGFGIRPSFDPPKELLEPYFFDFSGDLYGQEIEVALHSFLRPEAKFDSLDALTTQIARDCDEARVRLAGLV